MDCARGGLAGFVCDDRSLLESIGGDPRLDLPLTQAVEPASALRVITAPSSVLVGAVGAVSISAATGAGSARPRAAAREEPQQHGRSTHQVDRFDLEATTEVVQSCRLPATMTPMQEGGSFRCAPFS